jgi:hypothetical protein
MGFFDRFSGKKTTPPAREPDPAPAKPAPQGSDPSPFAGAGISDRLLDARVKLEAKDLAGAMSVYETLLAEKGDRPDLLVTLSGDLGSCGYVDQIIELVAPRYDAQRHGPATGLNLLQAYLLTHNTGAAQHLLDILFALRRPELEQRLLGFSNALAELIEQERAGTLAPAGASAPDSSAPGDSPGSGPADPRQPRQVALASISRPIWAYGVEDMPGLLPPKNPKARRVAFGQIALVGVSDLEARMVRPEDAAGRFSRGLPLWLHEMMYFCPNYIPVAAVGLAHGAHLALFPSEWTAQNIRQLVDTSPEGLDYVFTGAFQEKAGDSHLVLRLWEVKKFRERKVFEARWTPATADAELAALAERIRLFMEWRPHPANEALVPTVPSSPSAWIQALGTSLSTFLAGKTVLPADHAPVPPEVVEGLARITAGCEQASIAWLTLRARARALGQAFPDTEPELMSTPRVLEVRETLG